MNWEGKTALITGGSRGIGFGIASSLISEHGMNVMICGRGSDAVEAAVAQLRALPAGREVDGAVCNVRDDQAVHDLVSRTSSRFGSIDVLVNSAGVGIFGHIAELTPEAWREVIETNLSGAFYCCHEVVPVMRAGGGGYIINISSLAGVNTFAGGVAYNASKFGLNGFSEALMQDVRYEDIRVSYILPGSVYTDFGGGRRQGKQDWALEVDDVARVVADLLRHPGRSLPSRVEIRPAKPPRKK